MNPHTRTVLAWATSIWLLPAAASAFPFIGTGFDLFRTVSGLPGPGTEFVVPFEGVPLVTFDFGSGLESVGQTDTIIERLTPADCLPGPAPCSDTIDIELVALQLRSVVPFDFGLGVDTYYLTLQTERGLNITDPLIGPASLGTMDIHFGNSFGGAFDSSFGLYFDLRKGSRTGPIALAFDNFVLSSLNTPWDREAPLNAIQINLVNENLCGTGNILCDFWPGTLLGPGFAKRVEEIHPGPPGGIHVAVTSGASVPEPGVAILTGFGFLALFATARRLRRQPTQR